MFSQSTKRVMVSSVLGSQPSEVAMPVVAEAVTFVGL